MERELNAARSPGSESFDSGLPLVTSFLAVLLTLSFAVLILSVRAGLQLGDRLLRPNPFAAYEALWPGQTLARLAAYARRTPEGQIPCYTGVVPNEQHPGLAMRRNSGMAYSALSGSIVCAHIPGEGVFRSISVTVENDQIQELTLFSKDLHQDSLFLYWGAPDAITRIQGFDRFYLHWDRGTYEAMAAVFDANFMVDSVTLTAKEAFG